jgi:hypothetical protein
MRNRSENANDAGRIIYYQVPGMRRRESDSGQSDGHDGKVWKMPSGTEDG